MLGHEERLDVLFVLDTNTISEIFRAYYRDRFPSFWNRFDELARAGRAVSVRAVQKELENFSRGEATGAIRYLRALNRNFFSDPSEQEQVLVREMFNARNLSSANNRWAARAAEDREDADPFLIAKARAPGSLFARTVVVTQESSASLASIPSVCQIFQVPCIGLREMMTELGWQF